MGRLIIILFVIICFKTQAQTLALKQADSLFANGNYTKAINLYKKHENQSEVFDKIAKAYVSLGNYDLALSNYKNSIEANPDNALLKYKYAKLLSKTKKFEDASNMFYQLINVDYRNPNYHYELGMVLEKLKDSTAQNRFYSTFQLDSTHQKAIYKLAKHQLKLRGYESVDKYVDIGLESYPKNKELISLKAQKFYLKKDYENAIKWFGKLIDLNEKSQFVYEKLSYSYAKIYQFEKAIINLKQALKLDPKNATYLLVMGELYERVDDFKNAEKSIKESLLLQDIPLDSEYTKLALILNRQQKYDEAMTTLKKAIKENPENIQSHFFLANTKDKYYKDIEARKKAFEYFIIKFPDSDYVKLAQNRIIEIKKEYFLKED